MEITQEQIDKGAKGEDEVFDALSKYITCGGILLHSYEYPMLKDLKGNISKNEEGMLEVHGISDHTELDILLITLNYIYPIEIKTYSGNITVTSKEIIRPNNAYSDKSPVHQNEMHCRHLYHQIIEFIPNGDTTYFKPMVIFADKRSVIIDKRDKREISYIPVANLANAIKLIELYESKPKEKMLDIKGIYEKLMSIGSAKRKMRI